MRPGDVVHTVERRTLIAQRWKDVTADVLGWDGDWLTVRTLPVSVMTVGARWRLNGTEYQQRVVEVSRGGLKVRLKTLD